jgi:hypothetical protein
MDGPYGVARAIRITPMGFRVRIALIDRAPASGEFMTVPAPTTVVAVLFAQTAPGWDLGFRRLKVPTPGRQTRWSGFHQRVWRHLGDDGWIYPTGDARRLAGAFGRWRVEL